MTNKNEEAIKNLKKLKSFHNGSYGTAIDHAIKALEQTELNPSYNSIKTELKPCEDWKFYYKHGYAQAKRDLLCEDCISREDVINIIEDVCPIYKNDYRYILKDKIAQLPSVTPQPCEEENPNCTECRYYDKEKHHCPRFCRVIENTVAEITSGQERWIPCSERLPERDENVLTYHRNESFDYQYVSWIDDYSGKWAGFIGNLSDEVLAWMPLPEGYKEEDE